MTSPARIAGTVRITGTSLERGFFFIRGDNGVDFFGHVGELRGALDEETLSHGQRVTFVPTKIPKGWKANEIYLIDKQTQTELDRTAARRDARWNR